MKLQADDFELFGLDRQFTQDRAAIDARWKALQRQAHPDKFVSHGPAAQRIAMQWSVRINEAYQRLKDPISRAAYLCELAGFAVNAHSNTAMPADFLMQQMQWREELEQAADAGADAEADALQALTATVQSSKTRLLQDFATLLDGHKDYAAAVAAVRALMFIDKFTKDLHQRLDHLA
ncbi:MAG: Fe-S protein assembly co-chaperone HscB [Rhodoferax sp.]|nr:Fe-S protein assembly co-chaperone HscB [Rhodoferax sp.]